ALRVVPAARYLIVVEAFGVQRLRATLSRAGHIRAFRGAGVAVDDTSTVYGVQYYGEASVVPLAGTGASVDVGLHNAVPDPTDDYLEEGRVLKWDPVANAAGYSVCPFEFISDESKAMRVAGTTAVVSPCTDYRVRAEFKAGVHGAYSAFFS